MRERLSLFVLAASALTLLVDLYLPWQEAPQWPAWTGWTSVGDATAVAAVILAIGASFAAARPSLAERLPLARLAVVFAYLTVGCAVAIRSDARDVIGVGFHTAYGTYLALGTATAALVAGAVLRRRELGAPRSPRSWLAPVASAVILVSLLLPWQEYVWRHHVITVLGIEHKPGEFTAVAACIATVSWGRIRGLDRLAASAAVAVLAGATLTPFADLAPVAPRAYGAWLGLGSAAALLALGAREARALATPWRLSASAALTAAAAGALVCSLYMPWSSVCSGHWSNPPQECSAYGWTDRTGSGAGVLALVLVLAVLWRRPGPRLLELVLGVPVFVATLGFDLVRDPGGDLRYGAYLGFAAGALLVALAVLRSLRARPRGGWAPVQIAPIALCLAYLLVVVVPWWQVLPASWQQQAIDRYGTVSWLTAAGFVLALRLLGAWVHRLGGAAAGAGELVCIPPTLLALAALDLVSARHSGISWGGAIALCLCLLLAVCGWIETRGGLSRLRIPDVLRLDRLPEVES